MKMRLDKTAIDFRMQDRGLITNFAVGVKVHDLLVVDQMQTIHAYYNSV